jgi:Holliday junction resolvase RusA-like endonuclease
MRLPREQRDLVERLARENGGTVRTTRIEVARDIPPGNSMPEPAGVQVLVMEDWLPLGTNAMIRTPRAKWFKRHKEARARVVAEAMRQRLAPATTARRVTIEVDWPPGARRHDVDAFAKCVLDALQAAKLLVSDRYEHCVLLPVVYHFADRLRTCVLLEDIPDREVTRR